MNTTVLMGLVATAGLVWGAWNQVKAYIMRFVGAVIVTTKHYGPVCSPDVALLYFQENFRASPLNKNQFVTATAKKRSKGNSGAVSFRVMASKTPYIFWKGWRPIIVQQIESRELQMQFIRGMFDEKNLVREIEERYEKIYDDAKKHSRVSFTRVGGTIGLPPAVPGGMSGSGSGEKKREGSEPDYGASYWDRNPMNDMKINFMKKHGTPLFVTRDEIMENTTVGKLDMLALSPNVQKACEDIKLWSSSELWYMERDIPWKKGVLLYGPPGTGKTALTRALARSLNYPVISLDLSTMTNNDLKNAWQNEVIPSTPCIVLIEDIDGVFEGRKNIAAPETGGLSFDALLNTLDGVEAVSGILTIVTTNRVELLDEALGKPKGTDGESTRPGRIDTTLYMGELSIDGRTKIANRILKDAPEFIESIVHDGEGMTGAQFQEKCRKFALEKFVLRNT